MGNSGNSANGISPPAVNFADAHSPSSCSTTSRPSLVIAFTFRSVTGIGNAAAPIEPPVSVIVASGSIRVRLPRNVASRLS